jgi:DNA-directed RNA polymerase I and III subunit RPAC1
MCRECTREKDWDQHVRLQREDDHFIFSIESVGMLPPQVLFTEAVQILKQKCEDVSKALGEDDKA